MLSNILTIFLALALQAPAAIPDAHLEVTARQKVNGQTDKAVHLITLDCIGGRCSLTTVSLNQCRLYSVGSRTQSFVPAVERSTTWDNTLTVTHSGTTFTVDEVISDTLGSAGHIQYQFGHAAPARGAIIMQLTSFSGSFTKNTANSARVDYEALVGKYQEIPVDCPIRAPGIDNTRPQ
jgi:hypothetical protein